MDILDAMDATLRLAEAGGAKRRQAVLEGYGVSQDGVGWDHLVEMQGKMKSEDMSRDKLNRWLGYAQGMCVASGFCTLEEMKAINRTYLGPGPAIPDEEWPNT